MTLTNNYYTCLDFQKIYLEKGSLLLEPVLAILKTIEDNLIIPTEQTENVTLPVRRNDINNQFDRTKNHTNNNSHINSNSHINNGSHIGGGRLRRSSNSVQKNNMRNRENDHSELKSSIAFKSTPIDIKTGIEKDINSIRTLMNKISAKNYDNHKNEIVECITQVLQNTSIDSLPEDAIVLRQRVISAIFDIITANGFLSELYANLYVELIKRTPDLENCITEFIQQYKNTLNEIKYVDPNTDYDGFCKYNKLNTSRKSMITFIINLMKHNCVSNDVVLQIIIDFLITSRKYIDTENKTNEVEELTENVAIMINMTKNILCEHELWKTVIVPNIKDIGSLKAKEHVSLSSRVVFKYMDLQT